MASGQRGEKGRRLGAPTSFDLRQEIRRDPVQDGAGPGPIRLAFLRSRHKAASQQFQPLDRIAVVAPWTVTLGLEHRRPWSVERSCEVADSGSQSASPRSSASARVRDCAAGSRPAGERARSQPRGRAACRDRASSEDMQAIADLHFLEVAQMGVDLPDLLLSRQGRAMPRSMSIFMSSAASAMAAASRAARRGSRSTARAYSSDRVSRRARSSCRPARESGGVRWSMMTAAVRLLA